MIVSCPSCRTRYRHRETDAGLDRQAQCSRCEHLFPLVAAPRSYVLVRSTPGIAARVGMDDPRLAPALAAAAIAPDPLELIHPEMADEAASFDEVASGETIAEAPAPARSRRPRRELLVAMLLASSGAAAGYYGAPYTGFDPLQTAPAGSAVGLLLAWFWVRWAARKH